MNINDVADALIQLLAETATAPYTESPYLNQADLCEALDIHSTQTLSDVVTRASLRVNDRHPGAAILRSKQYGYRLADEATKLELIEERTRLRSSRTKLLRTGYALSAIGNGAMSRMVGQQLLAFVTSVITPALESMDEIIGGAL